jgi:hypothetical protein
VVFAPPSPLGVARYKRYSKLLVYFVVAYSPRPVYGLAFALLQLSAPESDLAGLYSRCRGRASNEGNRSHHEQ